MDEVIIRLDPDLEAELTALLARVSPEGLVIKHFVGMVDGKLRAEVRAREHPPPHFHITYDGEDASYSIETGRRLENVYGLEAYDGMIQLWWRKNKRRIASKWNASRPSDCPVGPIPIPD